MQCVTPDIGMALQVVDDALLDIFLPYLFQGATAHIPRKAITGLSVKQAGIDTPNPTRTAGANWTASYVITGYLIAALHGMSEFRSGDHALLMREGMEEIKQRYVEEAEINLGEAWAAALKLDA